MRVGCVAVCLALLLAGGVSPGAFGAAAKGKPPLTEEEKKKKAEEALKKQDDFHNWKARDYMNATALDGPVCVYIKDPRPKKNHEAEFLEGKDILGNDEVKTKLRAFNRVKIKNDGSDGKGWPAEWLQRADNGAVLVLFSGDLVQVVFIDKGKSKSQPTKDSVCKLAEQVLEYEAQRRARKAAKAQEEAAKTPPPKKEPDLPGLDTKKPAEKKKPVDKGPQDE